MNQILRYIEKKINKKRLIFVCVFLIIIILIIYLFYFFYKENKIREKEYKVSKLINQNEYISSVYKDKKESEFFGRIVIDKIELNELIYKTCSDELLKFYICKLSDENDFEKISNLVLIGHNYNNDMFFSKINKLTINDVIKLEKDDKIYAYKIYKKYEVNGDNLEPLNNSNSREITLITCNNFNKKRIIIKGKLFINDVT